MILPLHGRRLRRGLPSCPQGQFERRTSLTSAASGSSYDRQDGTVLQPKEHSKGRWPGIVWAPVQAFIDFQHSWTCELRKAVLRCADLRPPGVSSSGSWKISVTLIRLPPQISLKPINGQALRPRYSWCCFVVTVKPKCSDSVLLSSACMRFRV